MEREWVFALMVVEVVLAGGMMMLSPYITRRGLLFGVYVGEQAWGGDTARGLVRSYTVGGAAWMVCCLAVGTGVAASGIAPPHVVPAVLPLLTLAGFLALYLRAYFAARTLAVPGGPVPSAAMLLPAGEVDVLLPMVATVIGTACGLAAVVYAGSHYGQLPDRVPTHFGFSGEPDAWRTKSFWTVMLSPLMTLVLGIGLGVMAWLTARAKRAIRYPAAVVSAEAQFQFRRAVTRYLSMIAIIVSGLLTTIAVGSVNIGLGLSDRLPWTMWLFTGLVILVGVGGTLYLSFRYGQGGARLERSAGSAPLTNGLADNRYWVLGSFYVNHEDPAILVEHRFGLGYTLNFGNWKAVMFFVAFIGTVMTLVVIALVTN